MAEFHETLREGVNFFKRKDDDMFDRISNSYTIGMYIYIA